MSKRELMNVKPEPVEELNKQFWSWCAQERLCFQQCIDCGKQRHWPRPMCAHCGSGNWQWKESGGKGKVFSWTVTRAPFHKVFADRVPYAVLVVELDEGVRMVAGLKNHSVDDIRLGMRVEVIFERLDENTAMPFFQPSSQ